jgi:hypothetical protein
MLKDIQRPVVENIVMAVVREANEEGEMTWNVYLVNLYDTPINNVLVSSHGYGSYEGRDVKTSVLRHHIDSVEPNEYAKIETIMDNLFGLNNEFLVSFYIDKHLYDKKYVFLPESIKESNLTMIPVINKRGVMIR